MKALAKVAVVVVVVLAGGLARAADPPKPVSERQILELVELKIPDNVITQRVADGGVEFPADEEVFARLKKAGASEAVLAAVKKVAKPATEAVLSLWVQREYSWDNPLYSELSINGKSVGKFTSDTDKAIGEHIKPGWNTITLKTTPQTGANDNNQLTFRIGPVQKDKSGKRTMSPIWEFRNGTDWKLKDGTYTHQTNPDAKEVTLTYQVFHAGLKDEGRKLGAGDYVLTGDHEYDSWNSPVTAAVTVNGHEINTFLGLSRQVVITKYLHSGENVIKLVSHRVPNVVSNNDVKCWVGGPAEYNATRGKYELKPVIQFQAMQGWKRDPKTGQLVNQVKGGADVIEREVKFTLDHDPNKK
jgi:hypothetical protein